jgi:alpha-galactosidase
MMSYGRVVSAAVASVTLMVALAAQAQNAAPAGTAQKRYVARTAEEVAAARAKRVYDTVQPSNPTIVRPSLDNKRTANGLALTPPMGWNSWNKFGCKALTEQVVRDTANEMASNGMRDAGYAYLILDDCWAGPRDARGDLTADPGKFPSGMKALGDYIHAKGLKFGIYSDAGKLTCAKQPGSQGHEYQDAMSFASWGVDYVKYDWCHTGSRNTEEAYALMADALRATGRDIVFSICNWGVDRPNESDKSLPWEWGMKIGNLWRTTSDIRNDWQGRVRFGLGVLDIVDKNEPLYPYAGPGHWNDPDMLEVGVDKNEGLTWEEQRSHFSLWAMMAAPLIVGNDLTIMDDATKDILLNKEVIAVDQDQLGAQGRRVRDDGDLEVWSKPLADGGRDHPAGAKRTFTVVDSPDGDVPAALGRLEANADRDALYDLREIARARLERQKGELRARARREAFDHTLQRRPLKGVDLDRRGLADGHARNLGLLEVGHDIEAASAPRSAGGCPAGHSRRARPGGRRRRRRSARGSGCGSGPGAPGHRPPGPGRRGLGLGQAGGQGGALGAGHDRLVAADVVLGADPVGLGLGRDGGGAIGLDIAPRHRAAGGQGVEPGAIGLGADALGVSRADRGLGGADIGGGQLLLGVQGDEGGLGGLDARLGLLQVGGGRGDAGVELLGLDAHQRVAALHRLIVLDQHLGDQAAHLGSDGRAVSLDIGRVGGDHGPGRGQIQAPGDSDRDGGRHGHGGAARERRAAARLGGRVGQNGGGHRSNTSRVEVAVA